MQDQNASHQKPFPQTLGQILDALPSLANSGLTQSGNAENSSITGAARESSRQIGRPLSETVLDSLRNIAQSVNSGKPMDDQALETLLVQHFGSSRLAIRKKLKHVYGADGGYESGVAGYETQLDGLADCEMKIFDALEFLNRSARPDFVAKQIGRLQAVMARRAESNEDIAVVIDVYTEHLEKYPPNVVAAVCTDIIDSKKWFPLVSELNQHCNRLVAFRRAILKCFEAARNPLFTGKAEAKLIAADPRLGMSHRELNRKDWLPCHWDWYVGGAEHMAQLNRNNGRLTQADEWQAIFEKRQNERADQK